MFVCVCSVCSRDVPVGHDACQLTYTHISFVHVQREDFVRLKKVQEYKKKAIAEEEKKMAALEAAGLIPNNQPSMLDQSKDADDLFD